MLCSCLSILGPIFIATAAAQAHLSGLALTDSPVGFAETPTWRNGKSAEYMGQPLCNACQIWESRHKSDSLYNSSKVHPLDCKVLSIAVACTMSSSGYQIWANI